MTSCIARGGLFVLYYLLPVLHAKMSDLGLNIHHTEVIANYMAFTKLQRVQNLRTIDGLFQDVFDSRLLDSSYTVDEVQDILYSLRKLLKGELESGLMDVNHMNVLMLQQLFSQAENWHLKLEINLSELQNRSLLEVVKEIDQNGFAPQENRMKKSDDPNDPVGLLQLEIKKLNRDIRNNEDEIETLKSKLAEQEKEFINFGNARHLDTRKEEKNPEEQKNVVVELQEKIKELEEEIKNADKNKDILVSSEYQDHKSTKETLLQTQSQLKLAELELERKFKETTAFINMKKLLDSKNEQIKILRKKLENLEEHSGKTDLIEESENDESSEKSTDADE
ncbi:leucine zipper transcription factor-like protein 1 [Cloeon dipterum]|uniref:leucine zipper transcription factor-like protein 1 n=1 Tax=Cloeon dipterum TaxID=197152 RepID=UPI003220456F